VAFKLIVWLLSGDKQQTYKHLLAVEVFSHKFSIACSGETTDRIKKVRGCKKWHGPPLSPCQVWWDRGSHAGCRRRSVMFICLSVCLSHFAMMKFVITETLWTSISFKTILVSLHSGRFVVVHLYSTFSVDPRILLYGQIYTKNYHFSWFWGL